MESEGEAVPQLSEDLTYCEAFKVINGLAEASEITEERAHEAKRQYEALHGAVLAAMAAETARLTDAKVLKQRLDEQAAQAAADPAAGTLGPDVAVEVLREDEEAAHAEAELAAEKEQLQALELAELQRQHDDVAAQVAAVQEEHRQRLLPKIEQLREELAALQADVDGKDARSDEAAATLRALRGRGEEAEEARLRLATQRKKLSDDAAKAAQLPEKAAKQLALVSSMHTQVSAQHADAAAQLEARDGEAQRRQAAVRALENECTLLMGEQERASYGVEAWQQSIDSVGKEVAMKRLEAEHILSEQAELHVQVRIKETEMRKAQHDLKHVAKARDGVVKRHRKRENVVRVLAGALPGLQAQKEALEHEVECAAATTRRQGEELRAVKAEVDAQMMAYLTEEQTGTEKSALFVASHEQLGALEATIADLRKAEAAHARDVYALAATRDKAARQASIQSRKVKECRREAALKEVEGKDLRKLRHATLSRAKDFQQLYDLVKNQRNRFVSLLQAARQGIAEMRDKQRVLANELDILRAESNGKDAALVEKRAGVAAAVSARNAMRGALNRLGRDFRARHDRVDEQVAEIDKLGAIISASERDVLRLKQQYESAVELRNYTGVTLIDRNDELCILYEKANVQDTVARAGDAELERLADEARHVRIETAEVARSLAVTRRLLPRVPALDHDVAALQRDILVARREAAALELQLEDPANCARWRVLPGRVKDKDELRIKVNQLEERLNDKKEQLLERELILEEVTSLSNTLRVQAASGREDTLEVARRANAYQTRMRAVTRRMMATISELSMYQATALKQGGEKETLEEEVRAARLRLADGDAPTEEAAREWAARLREDAVAAQMRAAAAEARRILDAKGAGALSSTAAPRPHAYIPEQLGIPKPYGSFAPFKPVEPGATMRHIRKPEIREVVI